MNQQELQELERFVGSLARETGKIILPGFGNARAVVDKGHSGYATQFDLDAEKFIVSGIKERFPDHAILAEEGSTEKNGSPYTWVIDPIDGTHNYMHGVPLYCVSIALRHNDEHILGSVYMPTGDQLFIASKGNGARRNGEAITCSAVTSVRDAFLDVEVPRILKPRHLQMLQSMGELTFRYRIMGSAEAVLAFVAAGILDGYVDMHNQNHEWDWAAGKVLVQEAGGVFSCPPAGCIVASNRSIHSDLRAFVDDRPMTV